MLVQLFPMDCPDFREAGGVVEVRGFGGSLVRVEGIVRGADVKSLQK